MLLILVGTTFRFWTYGFLHKKEQLAASGPYSLCRHPLYLSSIVLTSGFCFLLRDVGNFVGAAIYFAVFYSITILWEEIRLRQRYGEEHERYCAVTPMLIPLGCLRVGSFRMGRAISNGGLHLVVAVVLGLMGVEVMSEFIP
jgi:protein-S-isoprenylcysteine O-methyltransferase Ste14